MANESKLKKLVDELMDAEAAYIAAKSAASEASRRQTEAVNHLNKAQKALDDNIEEWRKAAPGGSDWASAGTQRYPA